MNIDIELIDPVEEWLLVKPIGGKEMTEGGIALPNVSVEKPNSGIVARASLSTCFDAGDRVIFSKFGGNTIKINDEDYLWLKESDVYALVAERDDGAE